MEMALKNPSANCFRKFKGLQLTFQVVFWISVPTSAHRTDVGWIGGPGHGPVVCRRAAAAPVDP